MVLGAVLIAGCAMPRTNRVTITATPPQATPLPDAIGPGPLLPVLNPLTGLPVDDPAALDRRPLAAKISNAPDIVRPQAGIAQADLAAMGYPAGTPEQELVLRPSRRVFQT